MNKRAVLFIVFGFLIFLLAIAASLLFLNFYFGSKEVKVEPSPAEIEKITALEPGQILYAKVTSKQGNQIGLELQLVNPLNSKALKTIPLALLVEAQDEIVKFEKASSLSNPKPVKASFEDIKIGGHITVKILTDKKIILLYAQ